MSDLVLYSYFRSSASYRVRIALYTKGLRFSYRPVHLLNNGGEQNSATYRGLNPAGEVPTLVHKNNVISQSMAIIQYLDDQFPECSLTTGTPLHKAKLLQFCEGINCTQPYQNLKTLQYLEKTFKIPDSEKQNWLNFWLQRNLEISESMLSHYSGKFCFGDQVSIADCFLMPQLFAAARFKVIDNDYSDKYPNIYRVSKNCSELESFKLAHPYCQPDTPDEFKTK